MSGPPVAAPAPPTIWYMGVKTRVLDDFLDRVLIDAVPEGGTVLDLLSGTGVVAAFCARRFRTIANDVQEFSRVITSSLIEHGPRRSRAFVAAIDFDDDLLPAFLENRAELEKRYAPALRQERRHLEALAALAPAGNGRQRETESGRRPRRARDRALRDAVAAYREFLETPGAVCGHDGPPAGLYRRARDLLDDRALEARRHEPRLRPCCLVTAYYSNTYFGLRQSIDIDSLRSAIDALDPADPFAGEKRVHYLSALLHAASISTSGTSHFAQPRHLRKDSEVLAMAKRRRGDIVETFLRFSEAIRRSVSATRFRGGNRALGVDYHDLLVNVNASGNGGGDLRLRDDVRADLVYVDPPYTKDHYSRFYHVLEVLARYDYPELERDASGRVLRGRYPRIETRFQSGFCRPATVEGEFDRIIRAAAGSGAKLVLSYGSPGGLLLKTYLKRHPGSDPVDLLAALCRRRYGAVEVLRKPMLHSGQGDSVIPSDELLFVCERPR